MQSASGSENFILAFILPPSGREIVGSTRHHDGDDEQIACDSSAGVLLLKRLKY